MEIFNMPPSKSKFDLTNDTIAHARLKNLWKENKPSRSGVEST